MTAPRVTIERADERDAIELATVAARTFPLAVPPHANAEDVAAFISAVLSAERMREYLADPERTLFKAIVDGTTVGYAMLVDGSGTDEDVRAVTGSPTVELSKLYLLPDRHGSTIAASLMQTVVDYATGAGKASVWLGVNQENVRAQRFYEKHLFRRVGTKTFLVGEQVHEDFVMERRLDN